MVAAGDALGSDVRLAAAIEFKNLVKYRWVSRYGSCHEHELQWMVHSRCNSPCAVGVQVPTEIALESGTQPIPDVEKVRGSCSMGISSWRAFLSAAAQLIQHSTAHAGDRQ